MLNHRIPQGLRARGLRGGMPAVRVRRVRDRDPEEGEGEVGGRVVDNKGSKKEEGEKQKGKR